MHESSGYQVRHLTQLGSSYNSLIIFYWFILKKSRSWIGQYRTCLQLSGAYAIIRNKTDSRMDLDEFTDGVNLAVSSVLNAIVKKDWEFIDNSGTVVESVGRLFKDMMSRYDECNLKFVIPPPSTTESSNDDDEGEGHGASSSFEVVKVYLEEAVAMDIPHPGYPYTPVSDRFKDSCPIRDYIITEEDSNEVHLGMADAAKQRVDQLMTEGDRNDVERDSLPSYIFIGVRVIVKEKFKVEGEHICKEYLEGMERVVPYRFGFVSNIDKKDVYDWKILVVKEGYYQEIPVEGDFAFNHSNLSGPFFSEMFEDEYIASQVKEPEDEDDATS
jgi:hypothetical protein